jgi:RNA polymerase sigma factor (sigma-70 family)
MTAGRPGSRPRIRVVSDAEVAANTGLVHYVIKRMIRQGKIAATMEYDDLAQVGMLGLWEALQRRDPARGARSTYCSSYIWGYVMHHQRKATRPEGWNATHGEQVAIVMSWEVKSGDGRALRETLVAADDTAEVVEWSDSGDRLVAFIARLPEPKRTVARRCVLDGTRHADVAADIGVSRQRVAQIVRSVMPELRAAAGLEAL